MERILIVKTGSIGDVLMSTPMIRELCRQTKGRADIYYYVGEWSKYMVLHNPHLKEVISFDDSIFHRKRWLLLIKELIRLRRYRFFKIYILHRHLFYYLFFRLVSSNIIGFRKTTPFWNLSKDTFPKGVYHVDAYLGLININHVTNYRLDFQVPSADIDYKKIHSLFQTHASSTFKHSVKKLFIIINPGGGHNPGESVTVRQWGRDKFIGLVDKLNLSHSLLFQFFLTGGPNDKDLCQYIHRNIKFPHNIVDLSDSLSLANFKYLIEQAHLFVTGDTGGMHIAASSSTPVISIFGPTDPKEKSPKHPNSRYIHTKASCSPCYGGQFLGCDNPVCMKQIPIHDVHRAITQTLEI